MPHYTGGCLCGAVRYECSAEPLVTVNCHCRDCQRLSGSPFATVLLVPQDAVQVAGNVTWFDVKADSGNMASRGFCPHCGSPLFGKPSGMPVALLDTSVASLYLPSRKPRTERAFYEARLRGTTLALSFQSVAELWRLLERNRWGEARPRGLEAFLPRFLVIPFDAELAEVWARVTVEAERIGRRLEAGDGWIAATAVHRACPSTPRTGTSSGSRLSGCRWCRRRRPDCTLRSSRRTTEGPLMPPRPPRVPTPRG
jgi:hypothetical protein